MADLVISQPPLIDAQGNIDVHGRSGISLPIKRFTDLTKTTQVDISADVFYFEVQGLLRQRLPVDPNDAKGLVLVIDDLASAGLVLGQGAYPLFVLRDETGATPIVRWQGRFIVSGYEGAPP